MIRSWRGAALAALLVIGAGCAPVRPSLPSPPPAAQAPPAPRPAGGEEELSPPTREVLPNGLRLIIQDHRAA
ncbi:MAG: hypothetical protein AAB265_01000, partial [candidate division NC10 bacterium]